MTTGVYKLNFNGTNKVYIGQSLNIEKRYKDHIYLLRTGHSNFKLLEAYRLFGTPTLELLCECLSSELNSAEEEAISIFNSVNNGYNILHSAHDRRYGEDSPTSFYSNDQIIESFLLLVKKPELRFREICKLTGVSTDTIGQIACSAVHNWLAEVYPKEYLELKTLNNNRSNSGELHYNSKYSNLKIEQVFLTLVSNPTLSMKEVAEIEEVTPCIVESIAKLQNHNWLKTLHPEKYTLLEECNGNRRRGASIKNLGITYPDIISPLGASYSIENVAQFAREHSLDPSCVIKVLKGKRKSHKGWVIKQQACSATVEQEVLNLSTLVQLQAGLPNEEKVMKRL